MSDRATIEKIIEEAERAESCAPGADSVGWTEARHARLVAENEPFELELGGRIAPIDVEFETYGTLSPARDNVVLIAHALSGDAHAAGWDAEAEKIGRPWRANKPGWWDPVIGPGKGLDTDRYYVICVNGLGSCYGTTGPSSANPATGKPYGLDFPMVTVGDWVRLQAKLLDVLGIERIKAVVGGSLGGQQAIEWAFAYPERVERCIVFAASPRLSTQGLGFNAVGRQCILNDPDFKGGDYYGGGQPTAGLSAARMLAHITYLSDASMHEKFGRRLRESDSRECGFGVEYEVESYLDHQGRAFVERFDANSYLYITRAMDYYDAAAKWGGGDLKAACERIKSKVMIVSYDSDWLYPPEQCREFAIALTMNSKPVTYVNVPSRYGHDAFLVETGKVNYLMRYFLNGEAAKEDQPAKARAGDHWQDGIIESEIPDGASVLDLGCGGGELLESLVRNKNIRGQGVELDADSVFESVGRGVPVFQSDLDKGLRGFPDGSFDYVVLEETLQTVRRPAEVLREMLRVGKRGIVSFPNFSNRQAVASLRDEGRMPVTPKLPYRWHDTPNIHLFTINDFKDWAAAAGVRIVKGYVVVEGEVKKLNGYGHENIEEALLIVESE